jgi:threonine dehydratase
LIEFKLCNEDPRRLFLKPENQQPIGAFKLRGAYNKIASLPAEELQHGVITYSSGNHAQGVAYAARALGVKAVIVMPDNAPAIKREATAALGAEIVTVGPGSTERQVNAEELAKQYEDVIV